LKSRDGAVGSIVGTDSIIILIPKEKVSHSITDIERDFIISLKPRKRISYGITDIDEKSVPMLTVIL
jgi:hypothetical protein